jgi:hypothetical protein
MCIFRQGVIKDTRVMGRSKSTQHVLRWETPCRPEMGMDLRFAHARFWKRNQGRRLVIELDLLLPPVVCLLLSSEMRVGAGRRWGQGRPAGNWPRRGLPAGKRRGVGRGTRRRPGRRRRRRTLWQIGVISTQFQGSKQNLSAAPTATAGKAPLRVLCARGRFRVAFRHKRVCMFCSLVQLMAYKPQKPQQKPSQTHP